MNSMKFQTCDTTHFSCCQILWHYDFHAWHSLFIHVWVHIVGRFMIVNSCVINFLHMFYFYHCDQCHLKFLVWLMSSKLMHVATFTCRTTTFVWSIWSINIFHQSSSFMHTTNYMCDKLHSQTLLIDDEYNNLNWKFYFRDSSNDLLTFHLSINNCTFLVRLINVRLIRLHNLV
jgi:hypothetical protein